MGRHAEGYLRKRGNVWYLRYELNGKEIKQSLHTGDKSAAERERKRIMAPLLAANHAADEADRMRTLADAAKTADQQAADLLAATREKLTVAAAWQAYLDSAKRPDTGEATLQQYAYQWQAFAAWLAKRKPPVLVLADVTPAIAEAYFRDLRAKVSPSTFNRHRGLLRLVWKVLAKDAAHALPASPFAEIEPRQARQARREELSLETIATLCDLAGPEWRLLIYLGIYTGQRLGDLCCLKWSQVDLVGRVITMTPSKTAAHHPEPKRFPVYRSLQALLEAVPPDARQGHVVPTLAALYERGSHHVTDQFQALLVQAGVQPWQEGTGPGTGKRAVVRYGFHSLRHTFVTMQKMAGAPQATVAAMVGHTSPAMTARYTHVGDDALQAAVAAMPDIGGPTAPRALPAAPAGADLAARVRRWAEAATLAEADRAALLQILGDE